VTRTTDNLKSELPVVIALDSSWRDVCIWLERLKGKIWGFKVGSILFSEKGPEAVEAIRNAGFRVFLDLKYHDIPNTVQHATREAFRWGVNLLTVHASGGQKMLEAAAKEQKKDQIIVAVTVLTSLDSADLKDMGIAGSVEDQVIRLARLSYSSGILGHVCSVHEVARLRQEFATSFLVTPGVRIEPAKDDQKRTASLSEALDRGSSLVVVGRALTDAPDWEKAWQTLTSSLDATSSKKR
jgi:orotidine-5'-phosphate decarboxylase